jgi:hypothetical protein
MPIVMAENFSLKMNLSFCASQGFCDPAQGIAGTGCCFTWQDPVPAVPVLLGLHEDRLDH